MKYRDLFTPPHGEAREPKQQCLIWSANHEHAVASVDDEIHSQAKRVWLGFEDPNWCSHPVIYAYEKTLGKQANGNSLNGKRGISP